MLLVPRQFPDETPGVEAMQAGPLVFLVALLSPLCAPAASVAQVPTFDTERICRSQNETAKSNEACLHDEQDAHDTLNSRWEQFQPSDRSHCIQETSSDNTPSYVEILVCLRIADDLKKLPKKDIDFAPYPAASKK
jgi:hypothetical protein